MKKENIYAICWPWSMGGWAFSDLNLAIETARKHCLYIRCREIKIMEKMEDGSIRLAFKEVLNHSDSKKNLGFKVV